MRALVNSDFVDNLSLASVLPPPESELASRRGRFDASVMSGRWRKQMFERGENGGALQRAIEFVEARVARTDCCER